MTESVKVVSQIVGSAGRYSMSDQVDEFGKNIEELVNGGYAVKAAGCSGAGIGDLSDAHLCVAILQKNIDKLEEG